MAKISLITLTADQVNLLGSEALRPKVGELPGKEYKVLPWSDHDVLVCSRILARGDLAAPVSDKTG
jgi:hypothetical protein